MKKFTLLILLLGCVCGYGQRRQLPADAKSSAISNPKAQNNPIIYGKPSNSINYQGKSATDIGNTPFNIVGRSVNVDMQPQAVNALRGLSPALFSSEVQQEILADEMYRTNLSTVSSSPIIIANRNPQADIIPTAGATETFNPSVGDHFFDPGGPGGSSTSGTPGNYPNCGCDTQTTLMGVSEIEFQFFSVFATFDYLRIYDGTDATGALLYDNSSGGPNSGDITLADMIASHGSAIFTSTSGNFFFFFHSSTVVDYGGWDAEIIASGGGGGSVCANPVIEINQDFTDACMANISQGGLAQSYMPTEAEAAGAGIMFTDPSSGLDVDLSLWDGLPNAGGTMLASGTTQTDGTVWADVFWDPVVNVTVGNTYYIVIDGDVSLPCIAGSISDVYPGGNVFANNYGSFPTFDYTFRTYSCDGGGGGGAACSQEIPENNFENGYTTSSDQAQRIAMDITVPADTDFTLNTATVDIWMNPGSTVTSSDITFLSDAGGAPGAVINTQTGVVPTSQTVIGNNFGFDISEVVFDITPEMLAGQVGSETTYWISFNVTVTAGSGFISSTTATIEGFECYFSPDAGVTWIVIAGNDIVYNFEGICDPLGGGNDCTSTAYDSTAVPFDIDGSGNTTADCANAPNLIPITVADAGTIGAGAILENITIDIAHTWTADLDLYLVSPNGTELLLANDLGGGTDNGYNGTMFEDGGADITAAVAPFGVGPYEPMGGTFAVAFDGEDITGDWNLKVCDDAGGDTGQVLQFSMSICVPPVVSYDDCENAIALSCGDSVTGETLTATDSGGNPAPDVFYKFTGNGSPQSVTVSLCGGGTDYDSLLRVFDDCDLLNELAVNDDSCGLQSEVTFFSDGTSTYYIMVEGFGSNSGNFSLDVTCIDPPANDQCGGAIAVGCGDSIAGTTIGATIDTDVAGDCGTPLTAPGVWYSLADTSGLAGTITLSLCNGTDYDSKISVYTGDCSVPPLTCVAGNDDACGLQSEITFPSNGNTTFLILIHGFGAATGNFTLDVSCTPTPPPNDMIVNSIDVDEIGVPYTDPAVAMPAATTEDGNPQGCDLTGANGVWYNFVAAADGTATASIITPSGASSVTFYTAPDEDAVETDLVLVDQQTNQCVPGTTASINTVGGQAYYVFVLNTGAITDIVIDGTNIVLGVGENTIEGFSYYPNPTTGVLNLTSVANIEQVSLYNLLGQRVLDTKVQATASQVDISSLSAGTYLMKVTVNGQTGTFKVLKN